MTERNYDSYVGGNETYASNFAASAILKKVYLWMTFALLISAFTAMTVAGNPQFVAAIFSSNAGFWILFLAQIGLVWFISSRIDRISFLTATLLFIAYSVVTGITLSSIFFVFTESSIASVFLITAGTFGALSIFGYATKKDLTSWRTFLTMGLIGLILASVVNWFLASETLYWIVSYAGVAIFVGLTAYDTQKIKQYVIAFANEGEEAQNKVALLGSLTLYLDFINLFLYILRIFGKRK